MKEIREPEVDPGWFGTGYGYSLKKPAAAIALQAACSGISIKENTHVCMFILRS